MEFKPEFKVKEDKGSYHVPCVREKKKDGSIVMHAPSPEAMKKAMEEYKNSKRNVSKE